MSDPETAPAAATRATTPAAGQPQPHQSPPAGVVVHPVQQLITEVLAERKRLLALAESELTPTVLRQELADTNLDVIVDALKLLLATDVGAQQRDQEIVGWTQSEVGKLYGFVQQLRERVDNIEVFGGESQLLPEDAALLLDIVQSVKGIGGQPGLAHIMLNGPFPIGEQPEASKANFRRLLEMCDRAEALIGDVMLSEDDGDEDDGEEGAPSNGAGAH